MTNETITTKLAQQIAKARYAKAEFVKGWMEAAEEQGTSSAMAVHNMFRNQSFSKISHREEVLEQTVKAIGLSNPNFWATVNHEIAMVAQQ